MLMLFWHGVHALQASVHAFFSRSAPCRRRRIHQVPAPCWHRASYNHKQTLPCPSLPPSPQPAIHVHPALAVLFPLFAAAALAALLPLMMFLSFRREFAALHPAWPPHYLFLARRVFGALVRNNQMKVGVKASAAVTFGCL